MTFTPDQITELTAPLNRAHIKPPKKFGPKGDYLEAWHVINEANRIFGFDGWSYTIDLIKDSVVEGKDKDQNPQWQAAYTCICSLTVNGATRQDVGFGSGFAKGIGDAIEGATKEAVTDSLKRALRTFGNSFGLALYDKERSNVADIMPETDRLMLKAIDDCDSVIALGKWSENHGEAAAASDNARAIRAAYKARLATINATQQHAA